MAKSQSRQLRVPGVSRKGVESMLAKDAERVQAKRQASAEKRQADKQAAEAARAEAEAKRLAEQEAQARAREAQAAEDAKAHLETLRTDALATLGESATDAQVAAYIREQGVDPATGVALKQAKTGYDGPMIALRSARQHYKVGPNGILNNGDNLASIASKYSRQDTVSALIKALGLAGNPYLKLNPGQQSMNLRNKTRHAISEGRVSLAQVQAAYDELGFKPAVV